MNQTLNQMMERMKQSVQQKEQVSQSFKCNACKDKGYIFKDSDGYEVAIKCKCLILKETKEKMNNSGLGELLEVKKFSNYEVKESFQKHIKTTAIKYVDQFLKGDRNSFAIIGQSGIGKTHIMAAVARKLIDENINVKYYVADEIVQTLQACKFDEGNYNREFGKIANVGVLYIDDLFKASIRTYYNVESLEQEHLRILFNVINYRYNKKLPVLINSEIHYERFERLDQAMIGRIKEMCGDEYLISVKPDINKNYRLT